MRKVVCAALALGLILLFSADSTYAFSKSLLSSIHLGNTVTITAGYQYIAYKPKDNNTTLKKLQGWLDQSTLYTQTVPQSERFTTSVYIGPPLLHISDHILIQPAEYDTLEGNLIKKHEIADIIEVNRDGIKFYLNSKDLYDWLKNNQWKSDFQTE